MLGARRGSVALASTANLASTTSNSLTSCRVLDTPTPPRSSCRRGSRSSTGAPSRCNHQCEWKSLRRRGSPWRAASTCTQGSPQTREKVLVQAGENSSLSARSLRCPSTFRCASCDTQPCVASNTVFDNSCGICSRCLAWPAWSSASWLRRASRIGHGSPPVLLFRRPSA